MGICSYIKHFLSLTNQGAGGEMRAKQPWKVNVPALQCVSAC